VKHLMLPAHHTLSYLCLLNALTSFCLLAVPFLPLLQAASTVKHLMLPAHWTQRTSLVTDLVACYGCGGRSIVFTETKNDANELAASLSEVMGAR
jgi:hypothetical protein